MKRSKKDKLMGMAFGDLPKLDRSSLSPEELREFEAMSSLREDLRSLNSIPEPQISVDRVRDAILREGLKPVAEPKTNWSWLAMPAATCAIAFAIMYFRPRTAAEPRLMLGSAGQTTVATNSKFDKIEMSMDSARLGDMISQPIATAALTTPEPGDVDEDSVDSTPTVRRSHAVMQTGVNKPAAGKLIIWPPAKESDTKAVATKSQVDSAVAMNQPADSGGLVLIDQERDALNSTPRATEVGSPSNVLVGG